MSLKKEISCKRGGDGPRRPLSHFVSCLGDVWFYFQQSFTWAVTEGGAGGPCPPPPTPTHPPHPRWSGGAPAHRDILLVARFLYSTDFQTMKWQWTYRLTFFPWTIHFHTSKACLHPFLKEISRPHQCLPNKEISACKFVAYALDTVLHRYSCVLWLCWCLAGLHLKRSIKPRLTLGIFMKAYNGLAKALMTLNKMATATISG